MFNSKFILSVMSVYTFLTGVLFFGSNICTAQDSAIFEKRLYVQQCDTLPYRLLYPRNYDTGAHYPLIVFLHGSGVRGSDNEVQLRNLPEIFSDNYYRKTFSCFVVVPQCPKNDTWVNFPDFPKSLKATDTPTRASRLVLSLVADLNTRLNIDIRRIYLTGYSMGGEGTFDLISRKPDLFAAAVPVCPVADTAKAVIIKDNNIWVFHGADDKVNDVGYSRMMIAALRQKGGDPLYTEYPNVGHSSWVKAYKEPDLLPWIFSHVSAQTNCLQKTDVHQNLSVVTNVNIIPMTLKDKIIENATVVIKNNRIQSINGPVPENAELIDGKGKWLIPGLIDMHVHVPTDGRYNANYPTRVATVFTNTQDVMTPFIAAGVTTILELNSQAGHFGQRNEILRGDVIGPRMALAALINGGNGSGRIADHPLDGRQSVRIAKAEGYEFIKVYSQLDNKTYKAIVDEADKQGMKVVGHIPNAFQGRLETAFVPHFGMVAHAEEYAKQSKDYSDHDIMYFTELAKRNGTWLTPTLIVISRIAEQTRTLDSIRSLKSLQYVHPLLQDKWLTANIHNKGTNPDRVARFVRMMDFNNRLVKAFKKAGIPIVAGTDAGSSGVVWGSSLHDELELLVNAGLTPGETLISATRLPATWLGIDSLVGTVDTGKFADLILLDANPLEDIRNIRKISGVFVNGRWLDKDRIDSMLSDLSIRNSAGKGKYEWKRRGEY